MKPFADRLAEACRAKGSPLCVGLDPHLEHLPPAVLEAAYARHGNGSRGQAAAAEAFGAGVIEATAGLAAAVKVNIAFYERFGPHGMKAYAATLRRARKSGLLVIADVKRGDIGSTAEAYAEAHLGKGFRADAVTLNPLLGSDSMEPFLKRAEAGAGLFVLVRTSNPGSGEFQGEARDPASLTCRIADRVAAWAERAMGRSGWSSVGAVVGATKGTEIGILRARMPRTPFLLPGIGSQGGSLAEAAGAFDASGLGGLVTASRSVIFAHREAKDLPPARWSEAVAAAARKLAGELRAALLAAGLLAGCAGPKVDAPPPSPVFPVSSPLEIAAFRRPPCPAVADPLVQPLSVDLRDVPFRDVVTTLTRLSGVPVVRDADLPGAVLDAPIRLTVSGMPLKSLCIWIGRQADARPVEDPDAAGLGRRGIRFAAAGSAPESGPWGLSRVDVGSLLAVEPPPTVALSRTGSYDRLVGRHPSFRMPKGDPPHDRSPLVGAPSDPLPGVLEEMDGALRARRKEEARLRREAAQALLALLKPLAYASYEHARPLAYLPGSEGQLLVEQPVEARPWVLEAIRGLSDPDPPDGLSEADRAAAGLMAVRWAARVALPRGDVDTGEVLAELARQSGANIGWDPREAAGAVLRRVRLPGGESTLGEAVQDLARRAGFLRVVRESGAGVWLVGPREASSTSRLGWESSATLGIYPIGDLDARTGAETVQGLIRSRLDPECWKEPGAVLAYYPPLKRLVVRHRPEVHLGIRALLEMLRREGVAPFDAGAVPAAR